MKKKNVMRVITVFLFTVATLSGFFFAREYAAATREIAEYLDTQRRFTSGIPGPEHTPAESNANAPSKTDGLPCVLADFDALLRENPDTVGWLAVPGTVLNYPVVQAEDNQKYLGLSFGGTRSSAGTPFADAGNDMQSLGPVTTIYGHNMGAGRSDMFGSLLAYKDPGYYAAHHYIQFDTPWQRHGWWKVFAVVECGIHSDVYESMNIPAGDEKAFENWLMQAQALSLHGSDTEIPADSHILVLSTCDRSKYGQDGRLLILAAGGVNNKTTKENCIYEQANTNR